MTHPSEIQSQGDHPAVPNTSDILAEPQATPMPEIRLAWWSRFVPGARAREIQLARIQSGHQEVVGLVRTISSNLAQQVETQRRLLRSLDTLPDAVESLRHVGEITEQQREILGVIRGQLEGNAEQNKVMASSLDRFNGTLTSMESTTHRLADRAENAENSLRNILEQSQRRLLVLNSLLLVMVLVLIGGFAWYVFLKPETKVEPQARPELPAQPAAFNPAVIPPKTEQMPAVIPVPATPAIPDRPKEPAISIPVPLVEVTPAVVKPTLAVEMPKDAVAKSKSVPDQPVTPEKPQISKPDAVPPLEDKPKVIEPTLPANPETTSPPEEPKSPSVQPASPAEETPTQIRLHEIKELMEQQRREREEEQKDGSR